MRPKDFEHFARRFWEEAFGAHGARRKRESIERLTQATVGLACGEGLQFDREPEPSAAQPKETA